MLMGWAWGFDGCRELLLLDHLGLQRLGHRVVLIHLNSATEWVSLEHLLLVLRHLSVELRVLILQSSD